MGSDSVLKKTDRPPTTDIYDQEISNTALFEGFLGTLKVELYYLCEFQVYNELNRTLATYISFYTNNHYQKRLNGLYPVEFRVQAA